MKTIARALCSFDLYPRLKEEVAEDFPSPSKTRAKSMRHTIQLLASQLLVMLCMVFEVMEFLTPRTTQRFVVDHNYEGADRGQSGRSTQLADWRNEWTSSGGSLGEVVENNVGASVDDNKMRVRFNITVVDVRCLDVALDYQNVMGVRSVDVKSGILKVRLNSKTLQPVSDAPFLPNDGIEDVMDPDYPGIHHRRENSTSCGSCYGALPATECCDTCEDVLHAYRLKRWALPRIEQLEQCRGQNTEEAKKRYSPSVSMATASNAPPEDAAARGGEPSDKFPGGFVKIPLQHRTPSLSVQNKFNFDPIPWDLRQTLASASNLANKDRTWQLSAQKGWPECIRKNVMLGSGSGVSAGMIGLPSMSDVFDKSSTTTSTSTLSGSVAATSTEKNGEKTNVPSTTDGGSSSDNPLAGSSGPEGVRQRKVRIDLRPLEETIREISERKRREEGDAPKFPNWVITKTTQGQPLEATITESTTASTTPAPQDVLRGCSDGDKCEATDRLETPYEAVCAEVCRRVDACKYWSHGSIKFRGSQKCYFLSSRVDESWHFGFRSGAQDCAPGKESANKKEKPKEKTDTTNGKKTVEEMSTTGSEAKVVDNDSKRETVKDRKSEQQEQNAEQKASGKKEADTSSTGEKNLEADEESAPKRRMQLVFGDSDDAFFGFEDEVSRIERNAQAGESCRIFGHFVTGKVPGNFHLSFKKRKCYAHIVHQLDFVEVGSSLEVSQKSNVDTSSASRTKIESLVPGHRSSVAGQSLLSMGEERQKELRANRRRRNRERNRRIRNRVDAVQQMRGLAKKGDNGAEKSERNGRITRLLEEEERDLFGSVTPLSDAFASSASVSASGLDSPSIFAPPSSRRRSEEKEQHSWSPLDGSVMLNVGSATASQYYVTVTPNTEVGSSSKKRGFQYQSTGFQTHGAFDSGVYFRYEIDPIRVIYSQQEQTVAKFLIHLCAIVGGIVGTIQFLFFPKIRV
ncbi:unnamed protein product [Amoebophrya sp. A25]|nr:unnamed protein product [Amoebophrya sp. A25]|eukprot:GSA25T00017621001.1